jgi:8-oxo-dGTP pyrophosphatase MutT (NUDIX family)
VREAGIVRIEVHVAGVCLARDQSGLAMLALHRARIRSLFPSLWEGVGGQVDPGESFERAVLRHLHDEAGLDGEVLGPVDTYVIDAGPASGAEQVIPGVRLLVAAQPGVVEPSIDPRQHQGWRWVPVDSIESVPWIPGMLPQLERAVSLYRTSGFDG